MAKSTISMAIFNSFLYVYQAGYNGGSPAITGIRGAWSQHVQRALHSWPQDQCLWVLDAYPRRLKIDGFRQQWWDRMYTHTHIHIHIYIYKYINMYTYAHYVCMLVCVCMYIYMCTHGCIMGYVMGDMIGHIMDWLDQWNAVECGTEDHTNAVAGTYNGETLLYDNCLYNQIITDPFEHVMGHTKEISTK